MTPAGRIIAAMSGGVDSSVAAAILAGEGKDVVGVTMKIWDGPAPAHGAGGCCSMDDAADARRVCQTLGIPHYTLNATAPFKTAVVDYFIQGYYSGGTPNPCIPCNQALKFDYLFRQGAGFGATKVATGHYAAVADFHGRKTIARAASPEKDQSYYLFSISPDRLRDIEFPLAGITKEKTRQMARDMALPVAEKRESQEICFIPDNDYKAFIGSLPGAREVGEGDIVNLSGQPMGRHGGYIGYTVGQRKGLGISAPKPMYVLAVDAERNRIIAGSKDDLYSSALIASGANWFIPPAEFAGLELTAKIRSRDPGGKAIVSVMEGGRFRVEFAEPRLSITPGQAVVVYHGELVMGGGWIERGL
jgi:tRNA-specific 2-thiouridylase